MNAKLINYIYLQTKNRHQKMRNDLFAEIHDKLATDAFIEAHEDEIDRQAKEYNKYKRWVDQMRKEKEEQVWKRLTNAVYTY